MDNYKTSKIQKFLEDKGMVIAVYEAVRDSFLDNKEEKDTQAMASRMLSLTLLRKAWNELERFRISNEDNKTSLKQVGL